LQDVLADIARVKSRAYFGQWGTQGRGKVVTVSA